MFRCRGFWCRSVLLLLAVRGIVPPAGAAETGPTRKQGARVDDLGDPLPEGAVARIGTVRLRQPSEVCSVAFSPNGKLLATGGRYDGVRLWDATTGKVLRLLPAEGGQGIFHLSFSPDSKTLVSIGTDGSLEVWDVVTGKRSHQLGKKPGNLGPLCFSDDGKLLAVADGQAMRVWDTASWTERELPRPDGKKVVLASFAGKRMYVDNERGDAYLWDLASLEKRVVPREWRTGYWTALSPDGKRLASSGYKAALVVLRDVATGKESRRLELTGERKGATVDGLCYSPDGKLLAVGGRGIPVRCVDAETGKETARFGDQQVDYASQLAFSGDGKRLAVARGHGVRLWEVGTGKEVLPSGALLHGVCAVAFSPNGKQLAFGDGDRLRLYDVATRTQVWGLPEEWDHAQRIAFAPGGKTLVAGNAARLRFHDAATGKVNYSWGEGLRGVEPRDPIEFGLFSPDLERVVSLRISGFGDPDRDVFVRSARTGKELLKFQRRAGWTTAAGISPNGQYMAIGDRKAPTQVYNIASGKRVVELDVSGTDWHGLVFAPDGRTLASMSPKGTLQLLEVATGKVRLVLFESRDRCEFAYSPDGKVLASWSGSGVELWDTLTGRKLGRLEGHAGRVTQAAFAPGASILATAGEDTTILLWDVAGLVRGEKPKALKPEALAAAWKDLADRDAARAGRAMASLRGAGSQAVDFLRERLRPEQRPAAKQVDRWLKELDAEEFTVRERATDELRKNIDALAPSLRKALAAGPSLEVERRLTELIEYAEEGQWAPEALRTLRAIEVLEHVGSAEARAVLKALAGGVPEARLTREAKATLERLAR